MWCAFTVWLDHFRFSQDLFFVGSTPLLRTSIWGGGDLHSTAFEPLLKLRRPWRLQVAEYANELVAGIITLVMHATFLVGDQGRRACVRNEGVSMSSCTLVMHTIFDGNASRSEGQGDEGSVRKQALGGVELPPVFRVTSNQRFPTPHVAEDRWQFSYISRKPSMEARCPIRNSSVSQYTSQQDLLCVTSPQSAQIVSSTGGFL